MADEIRRSYVNAQASQDVEIVGAGHARDAFSRPEAWISHGAIREIPRITLELIQATNAGHIAARSNGRYAGLSEIELWPMPGITLSVATPGGKCR